MKAFLVMLCLTPLLVLVALGPIYPNPWDRLQQAHDASINDATIRHDWWDWKGSWLVCAGPIGRYVRGVYLGYRLLSNGALGDQDTCYFSRSIFSAVLTAAFAILLALFSVVCLA